MNIYIYTYLYIYIYIEIYRYISTYVYVHMHLCTCKHVRTYVTLEAISRMYTEMAARIADQRGEGSEEVLRIYLCICLYTYAYTDV